MKPLRLIPANDTFRALTAFLDVLEDKTAVFVTQPELNGLMPEVHGLSDQVQDDVALIVESSGSTGAPKKIDISLKALKASAEASAKALGGHGQWLLALPINFVAGSNVLFRSVIADTQPVMMNAQLPFTAEAFSRAASLMTHERRYTSLVPVQLDRLYQAALRDDFLLGQLRRFDAILVGGQSPNLEVVETLREIGVKVVISYGMTETAGGCVYDGVAFDGVELSIESDRVCISGEVLANGLPEKFVTNDLGEIVDGKLTVFGRADRVIISGGLKVSLDAVESFALEATDVSELAAIALDTKWGQSVGIAYVADRDLDFGFLQELSPAAKPSRVLKLSQLPRLTSGKPDLQAITTLLSQ